MDSGRFLSPCEAKKQGWKMEDGRQKSKTIS